jgi:nucleoside 2-deoxyribosyltransferase
MEVTVYLSIPIAHREDADLIEEFLSQKGIHVLNPCRIVHGDWSKQEIPKQIADRCWDMIKVSDAIILYTDYYGRDCGAEIGYAYASAKPVFPFYLYREPPFLQEDWMIKSNLEPISEGLYSLVEKIFVKCDKSFQDSTYDATEYVEPNKAVASSAPIF